MLANVGTIKPLLTKYKFNRSKEVLEMIEQLTKVKDDLESKINAIQGYDDLAVKEDIKKLQLNIIEITAILDSLKQEIKRIDDDVINNNMIAIDSIVDLENAFIDYKEKEPTKGIDSEFYKKETDKYHRDIRRANIVSGISLLIALSYTIVNLILP